MKTIALILLGAGDGSRFKKDFNGELRAKKQWLRVGEIPLWNHVAREFLSAYTFNQVVVALHEREMTYAKRYVDDLPIEIVAGGASRQESLQRALSSVTSEYVMVSDVARFLLDKGVLFSLLEYLHAHLHTACVVPYLPVCDTTFSVELGYVKREALRLIQTPQLSHTETLKSALEHGEYSDESSAIHAYGKEVGFVMGSPKLGKLTHRADKFLLESLPPPFLGCFVGNGFDVHAFKEGEGIRLCGVDIPYTKAFEAHSDGDVAIHALIDALLGAMGAGDIGEWFPDTCMQYKGIDSSKLLEVVMEFLENVGYEVVNVDLTIIAQAPKLSRYKQDMQQALAHILKIPIYRINIKATTTEKLGFIGRAEGIAVNASATLKFIDWRSL